MEHEKPLSEKESLEIIQQMINKAKNAYYDTGWSAIMWGTVIAVCALATFAQIQFGFSLPFNIWWLTLVAVIPQIWLTIKEKKERKVKSYDEVYIDYVWLGFGISIFLLSHVVNLVYSSWSPVAEEFTTLKGSDPSFQFSEFVSPLFLILYGMPTFITGAACKFKPMLWGGIFCWLCSIITVYTAVKVDLLLTAASSVMAWLIPGIIIEREYRNYKKEQAAINV